MTREEAGKLLDEATTNLGNYVYFFSNNCVVLDGEFTPEELKAIIKIMEQYPDAGELTP